MAESAAGAQARARFCRTSMLGLVRLLCQPKLVGAGALDLPAAWHLYPSYRAMPQIGLLPDPLACEAEISGLRLVTFDRDFERFGLTHALILPHHQVFMGVCLLGHGLTTRVASGVQGHSPC
ncbi:MAG: hypothetical protein K9J76_01405 [Polaromonas sp.]|nr:hypothetical protein [Polaromonas sp.]